MPDARDRFRDRSKDRSGPPPRDREPPPQGRTGQPSGGGAPAGNQQQGFVPPLSRDRVNAPPIRPPSIRAPLPTVQAPPSEPISRDAQRQRPKRLDDLRSERRERQEGGRTVITEPGRLIIRDPNGQAYVRHNEIDRFRLGARSVRTERVGNELRTVVVRPDGSQIITINDRNGRLLRRLRRERDGRLIIIIDNTRYRGPSGIGGFFVSLPPPIIGIPYDRYVVEYEDAPPDLIYETLIAPPVERIARPYSLDEIRYSPTVRERMRSIDLNTINFDTGSWEIAPDQVETLRVIADGMLRAIEENRRTVFFLEGHTDAVGSDIDNLSLSDRRAEAVAALLTQEFGVPAENLTAQGYGEQYLKVDTLGPERRNRRVTIRNITPLLNGGQASIPPPPPGVTPR